MATGDRIAIADKATLDQVKSGVDTANQSLSRIAGVGSDRDSYTASDILNKLKLGLVTVPIGTSFSQVLSETASGKIYMILLAASYGANSSNTAYMSLSVDSQVIINKSVTVTNNAAFNEFIGVVTPESIIRTSDTKFMVSYNNLTVPENLKLASFGSTSETRNTVINYSPKPIRFTSGFSVNAYTTVANCTVYYLYELD